MLPIEKNRLDSSLSIPFRILYIWSMSPRLSYGSTKMGLSGLLTYLCIYQTSQVWYQFCGGFFWIFSTSSLLRRNLGHQIRFPCSKWGRIIVVNSLGSVVSSMQVNIGLTNPCILDPLFTDLFTGFSRSATSPSTIYIYVRCIRVICVWARQDKTLNTIFLNLCRV